MVDARTSSIRPDRACIWATTSIIPDSAASARVDDHVDAVAQDVEFGVGDQHRDFDEPVGLQIQAGHLTVDPHQFVTHSAQQ